MKLITLNTWGGRAGEEKLLAFLERHRETDIFCLQEIWAAPHEHLQGISAGGRTLDFREVMTNGLQKISSLLSEHVSLFAPHFGDNYGLLMFVKKDIQMLSTGEVYVYQDKGFVGKGDIGDHARNIQYAVMEKEGKRMTVINFHGLWNGKGKGDSPERLMQSEKIVAFLKMLETPVVLAGDFNLSPETESLRLIEAAGLQNLVREYDITSTRSSFYTKPNKFADYIFVSPDIQVDSFEVLPDEVSDHLALSLHFSLK